MASHDDYEYAYDHAYEEFRVETGHITDIFASDVPLYEKVIAEYGDESLTVDKGYNTDRMALYCSHHVRDLSPFWCLFERIEKEIKNKT